MSARTLRRFRVAEWLTGRLIVYMMKLARDARDLHEVRHLIAQVRAGESVDCGHDCPLRLREAGQDDLRGGG